MADDLKRWISALKAGYKKVVATLFTRGAAIFLLFFIIAFLLWLMHAVGSRREIVVRVPITFDCPIDIAIQNPLPENITLLLRDDGRALLRYWFREETDTVHFDLTATPFLDKGTLIYQLDSLQTIFAAQLHATTVIVNSTPHVVLIDYVRLQKKHVPVRLSDKVHIERQYVMTDSIAFSPSLVTIYGQAETLDTITSLCLSPIGSDTFDDTVNKTLKVLAPEGVILSTTEVNVHIPVEIATEKRLLIPVQPLNVPTGVTMRTFPTHVSVTFQVAMSRFNAVNADDFVVQTDYLQRESDVYCYVRLAGQPAGIHHVRIEPNKVEFSLESYNME
ncbi:MAG: hypothetical protein LBS16_03585 [Prevotellaceae bacterium]|jgi:hypothetical protein|nr:hypothetical protein [Prevotellaceae bacterium]